MKNCPRTVPLNLLVQFVGGGTPAKSQPEYFRGNIPWVTPKDMKEGEIWTAQDKITPEAVKDSAARLIPENCVLLVVRSGVLKHSLPVAINRVTVAINQDLKALLCSPEILPEYLFHYLRASAPRILDSVRGTTADNISVDILRSCAVPLPPLDQQRRIAAILDKADSLRAKRRAAIAKLDSLAQSIFLDMFGDPVTNSKGWPDSGALGGVSDIVSGITKGRPLPIGPVREVSYLAVSNVQDQALNLSVIKTIVASEGEISRYRLCQRDLLLTEGGDPDKLGRGALWDGSISDCIHQNHVFRVRVSDPAINPTYLSWLVASRRGKTYFLRSAKQTTGIASINMTQLKGFPVLFPPIVLQQDFEKIVTKVNAESERSKNSLRVLDALFASLQHRAFQGDLESSALTAANV